MSGVELLVSDSWGVYIPQRFAQNFLDWSGVSAEDLATLGLGPNHQDSQEYWEIWNDVTRDAFYTDAQGHTWRLWQDGDLWCYCEALMTDEEYYNFFGEQRLDFDADSRFETDNWYDNSAELR